MWTRKVGWRKSIKNHFDQIAKLRAGFYNKPNALASRFQEKVLRMVLSMLGRGKGMLLDVGCGRGRYIMPLSKAGYTYVGLDISFGMLKIAKDSADPPRARLVQGSAELLPFKDESFDSVVCVDTLHHLIDRNAFEKTIRELARVAIKSDGQITIEIKNKVNVIYWLLSKCNPAPVAETVPLSDLILFLKTLGFNRVKTKGVVFPISVLSPLVLIQASRHHEHHSLTVN